MKRHLFFLAAIVLPIAALSAQQTAVTQTGDQVILYSDGTWAYVKQDSLNTKTILRNPADFRKSPKSDFLITSKRVNVGIWIDPKKWTFEAAPSHDAAEYELEHKSGSLYALFISENLDLPLLSLGNIALENARDAAPDLEVTAKEYRTVNGVEVLMMRMTGTIQDIKFSYCGYYYTADDIATQFLVYSSEEYMNNNMEEVETVLNGFVSLEN